MTHSQRNLASRTHNERLKLCRAGSWLDPYLAPNPVVSSSAVRAAAERPGRPTVYSDCQPPHLDVSFPIADERSAVVRCENFATSAARCRLDEGCGGASGRVEL